MMNFQPSTADAPTPNADQPPPQASKPHQEVVRITVMGSPEGVNAIICDLHSRHFSEANDWCPPVPTGQVNQVMRVLRKRLWTGNRQQEKL